VAYATPAQLLSRKAYTTVGDLISDDGASLTSAQVLADTRVTDALTSASGAVEAAVLVAERYTPAQLATLTGNSQGYLIQLTCDIAMAYLYARKPNYSVEDFKNALALQDIHLDRLRKGENIFNLADNIDAGLPDVTIPTAEQVTHLQLIRDRTLDYYPARVNQLLPG
jgi:hypothetical protein